MKEATSDTDPRVGWHKILIPDIDEVFSALFLGDQLQIDPLPFMYGRLDPNQFAFDCQLAIPFLAIDRVVMVKLDDRPEARTTAGPNGVGFPIQLLPLKMLAMDNENRCYIPTELVSCIIPVDPTHPMVAQLVHVTSESGLIIPQGPGISPASIGTEGPAQIVDLTGRPVRKQ